MNSWGQGGLAVAPVSSPQPAAGPHPGLGGEEWSSQGCKHGWEAAQRARTQAGITVRLALGKWALGPWVPGL